MKESISNELLDDLHSHIERDIAGGFLSPDQIVESAVEVFSDDAEPEALRAKAVRATAEALQAHSLAQSQWPSVTDCDRLDLAFAELDELGIISRQNFSCCGTCGSGEILDEMDAAAAQGRDVIGYTFYHAQDTESAAEGCGVCLNYGTGKDDEGAAIEIAQKVVAVLEAHGLTTTWDGTWERRIAVALDWKRRRGSASEA